MNDPDKAWRNAVRFQVLIQGDDGDELWTALTGYTVSSDEAQMLARDLLALAKATKTEHEVCFTAWIYAGRFVNIGDSELPDWTFEETPFTDPEQIGEEIDA